MALKKERLSKNTCQDDLAVRKTGLSASAGLIKPLQRQQSEIADEGVFYAEAKKQGWLNSHGGVWTCSWAVSAEANVFSFGDEALLC